MTWDIGKLLQRDTLPTVEHFQLQQANPVLGIRLKLEKKKFRTRLQIYWLSYMTPKEVRLRLEIESACDIDGNSKYKELLDIIIDHFGCRHMEGMTDKMMHILKFRPEVPRGIN